MMHIGTPRQPQKKKKSNDIQLNYQLTSLNGILKNNSIVQKKTGEEKEGKENRRGKQANRKAESLNPTSAQITSM